MNKEIKNIYISILNKNDNKLKVYVTNTKDSVLFKIDEFFVADQTIGWEGTKYSIYNKAIVNYFKKRIFDWDHNEGVVLAIWDSLDGN